MNLHQSRRPSTFSLIQESILQMSRMRTFHAMFRTTTDTVTSFVNIVQKFVRLFVRLRLRPSASTEVAATSWRGCGRRRRGRLSRTSQCSADTHTHTHTHRQFRGAMRVRQQLWQPHVRLTHRPCTVACRESPHPTPLLQCFYNPFFVGEPAKGWPITIVWSRSHVVGARNRAPW